MQPKSSRREHFIRTPIFSTETVNAKNIPHTVPPVVCLVLPGGEMSKPFLDLLSIPDAAYLVMEVGMANRQETDLSAIIQNSTSLPVLIPEQGMPVEANRVFLIHPHFSLYYSSDKLMFRKDIVSPQEDGATDQFLATLAAVVPDRHIVILPQQLIDRFIGGLRVVRSQGGIILAFTGDEIFSLRRRESTAADLTLEPAAMVSRVRLLMQGIGKGSALDAKSGKEEAELARIYLQLLRNRGMDFARRQQPCILRRIRRRMVINGVDTLKAYGDIIIEEAEELALFEELRSSLAGFSLDATLEHALLNDVLPRVLEQHFPSTPLRVWIPCCCGGQEAYAMAIFLSEYLREQKKELAVQIFATDLNKAASERSRAGIYAVTELAGLSARKRKLYFTQTQHGFQISRQIREMCVFATQNLFKDPPFSNIDIIIGFSAVRGLSQELLYKVFRVFHYSLRPNGCILFDDTQASNTSSELFQRIRLNPGVFVRKEQTETAYPAYAPSAQRMGVQDADNLLLSVYVPPCLLIDGQLHIIRFYGNTEPYIRFSDRRPSLHLLRMIRDELIFELELLLQQANETSGTVIRDGIEIGIGVNARIISIEIRPVQPGRTNWKLVIFREMADTTVRLPDEKKSGRTLKQKEQRIQILQKEASELRTLLAAASEDATRNQESIQIAYEEIMAYNEALQSLNEQLQSVNQQILSSNVELNTINQDINVRNRALELSAEYAHAIVDSQRQPMLVLQDDLRIRLANSSFYTLFGTAADQTQGQSLYAVANGTLDRDELRKALDQVLAKAYGSTEIELWLNSAKSGKRMFAVSISRIPGIKNIRQGLALSMEDITERKATERFKDEFIGIASHELKTPATSIQAYSQLLLEMLSEQGDRPSAELAMKLSSQVSRLTRLTKDLLDVTRITHGQVRFKMEPVDMLQLIAETVEELQVTTTIRLTIAEHPPLPPVMGDRDRLQQVLVNLLSNAIKYAPEMPEIIIRPEISAGMVNIAIQDFGPGISTESMRKIFDRYYRLDEAGDGGYPGVGLGLYIAIEIVRRHGGDIRVTGEKTKGSVFTVCLPAADTID